MRLPQKEIEAILHYVRTRHMGSEDAFRSFLRGIEEKSDDEDSAERFTLWLVAVSFEAGRVFQVHNPTLRPDNFRDYDPDGPAKIGG